ncbi:peptidase S9 [Novosphingobium sediminis]|uniref:Peptidase S9 n=1 Tax=Novosphingobium sediminis TaxID=707214 RepID=A0A512AI08_9SPHN|nr:S9 family peptidase [Novosphingobium sediminis]GEN99303.1 peptidase S9 [Novosphingobium sediminis]
MAAIAALAPAGAWAADPPAAAHAPVPAPVSAPVSASAPAGPAEKVSTEIFSQLPFISDPKLSPDGKLIAAQVTLGGKTLIGIFDPSTGKNKMLNPGKSLELNWIRWAGNDRVLISLGQTVPIYGEDFWSTRLLAYDVSTQEQRYIATRREGLIGDDVLWVDPEGKTALISVGRTIFDYPSVWQVDLATSTFKQTISQRDGVLKWIADNAGVVRAGLQFGGQSWKLLYRAKDGDDFRTVVKADYDDDDAFYDVARIFQGSDEGYQKLLNEKTGRYALWRFNFATRKPGEIVFEAPGVDVDDFDTKPDSPDLWAAYYTTDRSRAHWFDPELAKVQDAIDKAVAGAVGDRAATIVSYSRDRLRMLVHLGGSNDPGRYYLFDQRDGVMQLFAQSNEQLKPRMLAATRYTSYKTRDGLDVPAYLTLPPGRTAKGLSLIIMPHGGPYGIRDNGSYDVEVQFLANRGYAVLQPEYRGSGGYGKAFSEKGEGQWGRAMQDDLDDGMDWLAGQGTIDPKRVCIVGSSYGGYAALWGAVRNPERYRCAASFAGVSDLKRQMQFWDSMASSGKSRTEWRKTIKGDNAKFDLTSVSPLYAIDKLKVPVLLVHGDDDQRVPYKQSKLYADALAKAGKEYEFVTLKGEGHGFSSNANLKLWLDKLDAFLAKNNPAS